jgi:hypothetical protein
MEIISRIKNKIKDIKLYFKEDFKYDFRHFIYNFPPGKWWFCYRFVPKHRYNIVRLPLTPGYYENDMRLFYAIFAIFEDHVNEAKEIIGGYDYIVGNDSDYDNYLKTKEDEDEHTLIYYKINRNTYEDFHKAWHWWNTRGKNFDDIIWKECYDEGSKEYDFEKEEELKEEQRQMMLRVVNHWQSLWC